MNGLKLIMAICPGRDKAWLMRALVRVVAERIDTLDSTIHNTGSTGLGGSVSRVRMLDWTILDACAMMWLFNK